MFDLDPSDELALLRDTTRQFASDHLEAAMRDHERERALSPEAHRLFEEIGLERLEWPEALGGADLGPLARILVNEELAAVDPGAALALDRGGAAATALLSCGGPEALERWALPVLDASDGRAALVFEEDCALRIDGGQLSGQVPWVPADRIDLLVVVGPQRCSVVREGIDASPLRGAGLRAAGAAELSLAAAPVAASFTDAVGVANARVRARLYAASLILGVLRNACAFAADYAQQRVAFGRPIAHHQALAFLLTDMQMATDGARLLVQEAAWRCEAGVADDGAAAGAFAEAIEAGHFVGPNAVQVLGGHGFMQDYPMEKAMREIRALGALAGGFDGARDDAAWRLLAGTREAAPVALSAGEPA